MTQKHTSSYKPANFRIISIRQKQRILHVEDSLDIGKIRLDLYDYQRGNGARNNCDFYIDADVARLIAYELAAPRLETTDGLELQGGSRNGEVTARSFKLELTDNNNPYRLTIANGPGTRLDSGLITFNKGVTPTRLAMLLSRIDAKTLGLALIEHLHAWAANTYAERITDGIFQPEDPRPRAPQDGDIVGLCPTCHSSPCICEKLEERRRTAETGEVFEDQDPVLRYANSKPVGDKDAEVKAFRAYVAAQRQIPPDVDALRQWILDTPNPRS